MLSDFTPIVHKLDGRTIKVWAVADVHIGAAECDLDGFRAFLKGIEKDPDAYVVLCGDLCNNGLRSSSCPTDIYSETMPPSAQVELAAELLEPIKDKILGCVSGNHEHRTKKSTDIDLTAVIMSILRKPELYRQNMAFVRINLERGKTKDHYALLLVHGASANKRKQFDQGAIEGVDAIVGGHVHCGNIGKNTRLVLTQQNTVQVKNIVSLTATSWLDYGGYAARALYMPKATSNPQYLELEFTGTNAREGNIRVIW